jgi:hypothetical protein
MTRTSVSRAGRAESRKQKAESREQGRDKRRYLLEHLSLDVGQRDLLFLLITLCHGLHQL